jgi:hypothetical protein
MQSWKEDDLISPPHENKILNSWKLGLKFLPPNMLTNVPTPSGPSSWQPLPLGFLKLNFDGASKGNPRPVGFGDVFWDCKGDILHFLAHNIGYNTNNSTKLRGMLKGLHFS